MLKRSVSSTCVREGPALAACGAFSLPPVDGTTTDIHRARAEYRGGMWHVYPVVTQDFTYSSTSLKNAAEYWENDLRKGTKPWEISK